MADDFDSFLSAISDVESGGNYKAVNSSSGALGRYQIMPANVGPWSQQYLGYKVSTQEFEDSPSIQDQLAGAVLKDYYTKWGAAGAAAAWNAGPGHHDSTDTPYVQSVLGHIGTGTTSSTAPAPVSQLLDLSPGSNVFSSTGTSPSLSLTPEVHDVAFMQQQMPNALTAGPTTPGKATSTRNKMITYGMSLLGTPYDWGGANPQTGMDCSGYMQVLYKSIGIDLPRVSYQQANAGQRTAVQNLQPGDLVAWDENARNNGADHIAMWLGNNQVLEEPHTGASAQVRTLSASDLEDPHMWGVHMSLPGDN